MTPRAAAEEIAKGKHWEKCKKPAPYAHYSMCDCVVAAIEAALIKVREEGYKQGALENKTADSYFERIQKEARESALEEAAVVAERLWPEPQQSDFNAGQIIASEIRKAKKEKRVG